MRPQIGEGASQSLTLNWGEGVPKWGGGGGLQNGERNGGPIIGVGGGVSIRDPISEGGSQMGQEMGILKWGGGGGA